MFVDRALVAETPVPSPAYSVEGGPDCGAHPGPAMAQQRALPQSKETLLQSYNKRLKDDIKSIMDNFTEIIKTAKVASCSAAWEKAGTSFPWGSRLYMGLDSRTGVGIAEGM